MQVVRMGPILNVTQQQMLNLNFSPREIKNALWSIPIEKSSGLDCYNNGFYKAAWAIIGPDIIKAIQIYFETGETHKAWAVIAVTFILKGPNANTRGDFRHISLSYHL